MIQRRLRNTLQQRRQDMADLQMMFAEEKQVLLSHLMSLKKKQKEDYVEEFKTALLGL